MHNKRRQEMGLSWEAYIDSQAPDWIDDLMGEIMQLPEKTAREVQTGQTTS